MMGIPTYPPSFSEIKRLHHGVNGPVGKIITWLGPTNAIHNSKGDFQKSKTIDEQDFNLFSIKVTRQRSKKLKIKMGTERFQIAHSKM